MDWMNDSDWNTQARFSCEAGEVHLAAHVRGNAGKVTVEPVPGPAGTEMLVLVRGEAGHTGAALRLRDLLRATATLCPELWKEVQDSLPPPASLEESHG